jgi:endonuclease YncB( thermonuclease family)
MSRPRTASPRPEGEAGGPIQPTGPASARRALLRRAVVGAASLVSASVGLAVGPAQARRAAAASPRQGDTLVLEGEVVAVIDGDTLELVDAQREKHRIRLAGIDAPEHDQAHGEAATHALAALAMRREVMVTGRKFDMWQRLVGRVWLDGRELNLELVAAGHAWHDRLHLREQTAQAQRDYQAAEQAARDARLGLWALPEPEPPAVFRRRKDLSRTIDATGR